MSLGNSIINRWKSSMLGDPDNPAGMIELDDDLDVAGGETLYCSYGQTACCRCYGASACC